MVQTNEQLPIKGGIGRHFPGSKDLTIPNSLPDDPEEDIILKSIWTATNPLIVPVYEARV